MVVQVEDYTGNSSEMCLRERNKKPEKNNGTTVVQYKGISVCLSFRSIASTVHERKQRKKPFQKKRILVFIKEV